MKIYAKSYSNAQQYFGHLNIITKNLRDEAMVDPPQWVSLYYDEPDIAQADICALTYNWTFYVLQDWVADAHQEVQAARQNGKHIIIFSVGDFPAKVPFDNVILFERAGYRSAPGLLYHSAMPCFLADFLSIYSQGELKLRPKSDRPVIGFCGLVSDSLPLAVLRMARLKLQQVRYTLGSLKLEPPPFETTYFRRAVLKRFEGQPGIETNYLLRKRYRAGLTPNDSYHHPAMQAYADNLLNSDYTVCMRGRGNFSQRFDETLSLGRIPIFIDTDCLLPFQDEIDYPAYFPWIEAAQLPHAAEYIRDYHASLSTDDFIDLQKACRKLWEEHIHIDSFFRDLQAKLSAILAATPASQDRP